MRTITTMALTLIALTVAAPARADERLDQYFADLAAVGVTVKPDKRMEAYATGLSVCVDLFNGVSMRDELDSLIASGAPDDEGAMKVVTAAQKNFCPKTRGLPA